MLQESQRKLSEDDTYIFVQSDHLSSQWISHFNLSLSFDTEIEEKIKQTRTNNNTPQYIIFNSMQHTVTHKNVDLNSPCSLCIYILRLWLYINTVANADVLRRKRSVQLSKVFCKKQALFQCLLTYKIMTEVFTRTCRGNAMTWMLFKISLKARWLLKIKARLHFSK